ncbi:MAG: glycosyltransferase [Cecembia sp.]
MLTFYLLLGILYALALLWLGSLWAKSLMEKKDQEKTVEWVSILIPFRNEAENIPKLFASLIQLRHRPFEVLFVDDHSEDEGRQLLSQLIMEHEDLDIRFTLLQNQGKGKKEAVETAIKYAEGTIMLATDADCDLPADWIAIYLYAFNSPTVQLAAGPVMSHSGNSLLSTFQQIEWASILLMTKMGFVTGRPLMCSAANMAYRKEAFLQVGGYTGNKQHFSGDDEFLLKKISKHFGGKSTVYLPENKVWTSGEASWSKLFAQRARWASKWRMHGSFMHGLFAFLPFLLQISFLGSVALLNQGWLGPLIFLWLWSLKFSLERKVLGKVLKDFSLFPSFKNFLFTSVWHPFYVVIVGFKAVFGKIQWKGRNSAQFN